MLQLDAIHRTHRQTHRTPSPRAPQARSSRWTLLAVLAATSGCSDDPVSLGGALAVDRSALCSYAAVWEGYVEAHTFGSGSDRVQLVLDESGQGSVTFGEGTPRPMPTDPVVPFPDLDEYRFTILLNQVVHEGLPYEIGEARIEAERLRVRTGPFNVYRAAACALQTPIDRGEDLPDEERYTCMESSAIIVVEGRCYVPDSSVAHDEQPLDHEVSCQQWQVCSSCVCDATGCAGQMQAPFVIDGALDATGTRLEGSVANALGPHTIRLTKQP
jgi:hypothetical protein